MGYPKLYEDLCKIGDELDHLRRAEASFGPVLSSIQRSILMEARRFEAVLSELKALAIKSDEIEKHGNLDLTRRLVGKEEQVKTLLKRNSELAAERDLLKAEVRELKSRVENYKKKAFLSLKRNSQAVREATSKKP